MEDVRRKMEEVKKKHMRQHAYSQGNTESASSRDNSPLLIALGGVVAGLTIAGLVWLARTTIADHIDFTAATTADIIQPGEFRKSTETIAELNERVEALNHTVGTLEAKLTRVMEITDAISSDNENHAGSSPQDLSESDEHDSENNSSRVSVSRTVRGVPETREPFVATHMVKAKLNLRPTTSLDSKPIAVLKAGTEVQYIRESDGWDYVMTQSNVKGWCSSEYLSPVLPREQRTSAN
jgi:hypothetical protein